MDSQNKYWISFWWYSNRNISTTSIRVYSTVPVNIPPTNERVTKSRLITGIVIGYFTTLRHGGSLWRHFCLIPSSTLSTHPTPLWYGNSIQVPHLVDFIWTVNQYESGAGIFLWLNNNNNQGKVYRIPTPTHTIYSSVRSLSPSSERHPGDFNLCPYQESKLIRFAQGF